ncbi:MAG: twin transmembrane helix small protein [Proteobacteria bacterium]|jgi:predicted nucleic acid-binding Zn ribbon protein|nr:twin transmembrane helix small protein [Pseudomonadota bacterium]MDA0971084.1 twin transmembrane helix small protein [Pseudomonadota bacterium]MDA0996329.1 twin transmembrane helix small protein [Pseudomonadota bacterium]
MSQNTLSFFGILIILAVLVVLIRGLKSFFKGGDMEEKRKSNKLMQLRIFLQFCAIIVLMALAAIYGK